jgi:membrane-associated phospholipid phosphatase
LSVCYGKADTDGNAATEADPSWTTLIATPPFPAYTSGHSTFSGAASEVLAAFFGDDYAFETLGEPSLALPPRQFISFAAAAEEAGMSRIYGGIHFMSDNIQGLNTGRVIAHHVLAAAGLGQPLRR